MDEKKIKMHLPKIDDLFTTQEERDNANNEKVVELDINKIDDIILSTNLTLNSRAEELDVETFIKLFRKLNAK